VSLDAGRLGLSGPPEVAGDPTENEATGTDCEIEMIDDDKIVNVMHRCAPIDGRAHPRAGFLSEL
jgi:hypothetical protein